MKKLFKELRNNNLWVYLLSFSAIILFVVLIMGTYLYWYYYQTIYRDFMASNREYLSAIADQHENNILVLNDIMSQLSLAGNNVEFVLDKQPEKNYELRDTLYQYTSVSRFFDRLFFFYHGDRYLYNSSTSVSVERFLERGVIMEDCSARQLKEMLYREEKGIAVLPEQKVQGYLVKNSGEIMECAVGYFLPIEPKRHSMLFFLVSGKYYDSLLAGGQEDMRQTGIWYQGDTVVKRGGLDVEPNLKEHVQEEGEGQYDIMQNGQEYLVAWEAGESGLIYYTVQSEQIFQNKIMTGQWGILLVLLISSVPSAFAFWMLARRLSGKVRRINVLLGTEETYDLNHLENGVRVLVEKGKEDYEGNMTHRRTGFISNFVRGNFPGRQEAIEAAKKAEIDADKPYYVISLMGNSENGNEDEEHERMLQAIEARNSVDGFGIHLVNGNQSLYVLFGNSMQELKAALEELFVIGKNNCKEFVMAASEIHREFCRAADVYLEADAAYAARLLVDNGRIIYFKDVNLNEKTEVFSDSYMQRLKHAIRTGEEMETGIIIQEICGKLRSSGQSLLSFRLLCNDIIHMLLTEWGTDISDFEDIYNVFALSQCLTINDFHDVLWEVCSRLMKDVTQKGKKEPDFVAEAAAYMKQHYQDVELNMSSLAEHLGVSGVTLAVKFKNVMEISPSDYLLILRMEQAKKMLRETNRQVKEVSLEVGYEDARVFMRRFKKYTGMTPGQFRMQEKE